jgi:hypothetical protein
VGTSFHEKTHEMRHKRQMAMPSGARSVYVRSGFKYRAVYPLLRRAMISGEP